MKDKKETIGEYIELMDGECQFKEMWDYQQKKIDELAKENKKLINIIVEHFNESKHPHNFKLIANLNFIKPNCFKAKE